MAPICKRCGTEVIGRAVFCPRCGKRLTEDIEQARTVEPLAIQPPETAEQPEENVPRGTAEPRPSYRLTLLAFLLAVLVAAAMALLIVAAYTSGMQERRQASLLKAEEHYQLGMRHLERGEYELAVAEFEYVQLLNPDHPEARSGIAAARTRMAVVDTPTPMPTITPRPAADDLALVRQAFSREDWEQVIILGTRFRSEYPGVMTAELEPMLFAAYTASAAIAVEQDRLGEAIRYYDQALALRPGDPDISLARQKAVLYQEGLSLWAADWQGAIAAFTRLVEMDIGYKDVYLKLYNAYIGYAQEAAEAEAFCVAAEQYAYANQLIPSDEVAALQSRMETACKFAPTAPPPAAPGTFVGRIVRTDSAANQLIYISGYVLDSSNKAVKAVRVMIKAWDWSAIATTDSSGHYSFDGLTTPATYTLSLPDLTALPIEVPAELSTYTQVNFEQMREDAVTEQAAGTTTPAQAERATPKPTSIPPPEQ